MFVLVSKLNISGCSTVDQDKPCAFTVLGTAGCLGQVFVGMKGILSQTIVADGGTEKHSKHSWPPVLLLPLSFESWYVASYDL